MKRLFFTMLIVSGFYSLAQIPCESGFAGSYPCQGIDLYSNVSALDLGAEEHQGIWVNDIWGWADPETGKEYALVGMSNGTSFVDVSDPLSPVVLGVLPEHNSISGRVSGVQHDGAKSVWRDIKVYKNHAYVVSEDPEHGIQVFDLTHLRNVETPGKDNLFGEDGHYDGLGQSHNIFINEDTGFLYAVGFRQSGNYQCNGGGLHIVDLSEPTHPVFAGCFDNDGYTHDTQCVIYHGPDEDYKGREICFSSNEDDITLADVEDKNNITLISKSRHSNPQYIHQGWLTDDHRYFIANDELDENNFGQNTRTYLWDMADLDAPLLLGYYEHGTKAIDHNLYVKGSLVYESNYTNGLRILDHSKIAEGTLEEVAYFDTYRSNDATTFDGTWSNYPYLPSGNLIVSDISNGLFVLRQQEFYILKQPENITACVGEHVDVGLVAYGEDVDYQWQISEGETSFKNIDNFERYKNTQTDSLHAHTLEMIQDGIQFRCLLSKGGNEVLSEVITFHVIDTPRASFTHTVDAFGTVEFVNTSENGDEYFWDFGNEQTATAESPTYKYSTSGVFGVTLVVSNGCTSDTLTRTVDFVIASVAELSQEISVYPSIADDIVHIENATDESFHIDIMTLSGHLVMSNKMVSGINQFDVSGLSEGIYLIRFMTAQGSFTKKFIKYKN